MEEEIKKIKDFLKFNLNAHKTYPMLWDTLKTMLRGKFILLSVHLKKQMNNHTRELTAQQKSLEHNEANTTP